MSEKPWRQQVAEARATIEQMRRTKEKLEAELKNVDALRVQIVAEIDSVSNTMNALIRDTNAFETASRRAEARRR
jgi:hypothetical protein